jgi:hypothetical protein
MALSHGCRCTGRRSTSDAWPLTHREGIGLLDLVGFQRSRLFRDVLLGLALIPVSLVFIFAGTAAAGWIVYGAPAPPYFLGGLAPPAALYGVLVWPFVWGLTEQMTYNGYLLPRFQVLCRSTGAPIAIVAFAWSLQHAFMPLTFDAKFHGISPVGVTAVIRFRNTSVSATSPADPARYCARPVGWRHRADPLACSQRVVS